MSFFSISDLSTPSNFSGPISPVNSVRYICSVFLSTFLWWHNLWFLSQYYYMFTYISPFQETIRRAVLSSFWCFSAWMSMSQKECSNI
jgi:hypothetical protein